MLAQTTTKASKSTVEVPGLGLVELARITSNFSELTEAERADWVYAEDAAALGHETIQIGDVAYASALGDMRCGVVTKIGPKRITVTMTTRTSINDANKYGWDQARIQETTAHRSGVRIHRPAAEQAPPVEVEETEVTVPGPIDKTAILTKAPIETLLHSGTEDATPAGAGASGSKVIAALEALWTAFQKRVADLPDVVIITGTGAAGGEWGHTWHESWEVGSIGVELEHGAKVEVNERTKMTEVSISGERLACGAKLTAQTLLHEAVHVLARVRGIKDTSRQCRYHNKKFVEIARELGLDYPHSAPDKTIGFSAVEWTEEGYNLYLAEIADLAEAINLYLPLTGLFALAVSLGTISGGDGGEGKPVVPPTIPKRPRRTTGPSRNLSVATCSCEEPRKMRMAPKTLEKAPVICGACGEHFTFKTDEEVEDDE